MTNHQHLSIYFSNTRSYFVVCEETKSGLLLTDIQSTSQPITQTRIINQLNAEGVNEIQQSLTNSNIKPNTVSIVLPSNNFIICQIPFVNNLTGSSLKQLIEMELKYHFDEIDINKISINITPFLGKDSTKDLLLITIFERKIIDLCNDILACIDTTTKEIVPSHFSVYRAFIHNYPEHSDNNLLLGINDKMIEFSLINNSRPETLNFREFDSEEELEHILYHDILDLTNIENTQNIFIYGEHLTKHIYDKISDYSTTINKSVARMSAFRKMQSKLDLRGNQYCARTTHIYPACIGTCCKNTIETIELLKYENN